MNNKAIIKKYVDSVKLFHKVNAIGMLNEARKDEISEFRRIAVNAIIKGQKQNSDCYEKAEATAYRIIRDWLKLKPID